MHVVPNFPFRSISNHFWDKCEFKFDFNFLRNWKFFGNFKLFLKILKYLHVIQNFRVFRSISDRFRDKCIIIYIYFMTMDDNWQL